MGLPGERLTLRATLGVGLLLGVVLAWASVFLIPTVQRLGVPERAAQRLPFVAFGLGLALVVATRRSRNARELLFGVFFPFLAGASFWFVFGIPIAAFLIWFANVSDETATSVALAAFGLGFALGAVSSLLGGVAIVRDWIRPRSKT